MRSDGGCCDVKQLGRLWSAVLVGVLGGGFGGCVKYFDRCCRYRDFMCVYYLLVVGIWGVSGYQGAEGEVEGEGIGTGGRSGNGR